MAEGQHRRGHQSGVRSRSENGVVLSHARIQSDHGKGGAMTSVSPTSESRGMSKQEVLQRLRANKTRAGVGGATTSPTHGPTARSLPNNGRPHSSLGISGISSNIKVEVEVHTRLPQADKPGEIGENRHERRSRASAGDDNDSPVPPPRRRYSNSSIFDQDHPDARQADAGSPQVQNSDAERQRRSSKEPVPLPRHHKQRSMSQDRGTRQQRRSEAERQFLLQQYDLMQIQKQKQQEEDKGRTQQHSRDAQKEKLKQELKLLNEHENRVMHKLQKYDGGKAEEVGVRSWVRKQSQTLDRQQEVKVSASGTHQYMEATNRVMLEQQLMEKWKEARGQQARPNQAQDPRQQRGETTHHQRTSDMHDASHQQLAQQREQRRLSHQPQLQKSSPPPVLPKPRSPKSSQGNTHQLQQHPQQRQQPQQPRPNSHHTAAEAASQRLQQEIPRQHHHQHGRHSHPQQPQEDGRRNSRHMLQQETNPIPRPRSKASDRTADLSPRGRDPPSRSRKSSSPRSSEASAQSHSSSDSSEVRLLNFKRLSSVGDAPIPYPSQLEKGHRPQTHAGYGGHGPSQAESSKPQIRSPVARLSQAFRSGTSSEAGQRHRPDRHSDDRERLAKETSGPLLTSTPVKSGITSREMEEIIKRTAARMMEEQQQMRVAEARLHANQTSVQGPERPRRRRRERPETEGQRGGANPSQSAGNGSHIPTSITGSHSSDTGSRDTSTAIHAEVTRRTRSRRRGSGGVSGSTETGGSETQTSQSTINAPSAVRARADVAAGAGPDLKTAAARGVAGVKAVTSTNELNHVQRESNKVRLDAASVQRIEGVVPTVADTIRENSLISSAENHGISNHTKLLTEGSSFPSRESETSRVSLGEESVGNELDVIEEKSECTEGEDGENDHNHFASSRLELSQEKSFQDDCDLGNVHLRSMPEDTTVNKVDSEILPEDAVLNEALNLLDELANSEHKSNSETGAPPQSAASRSHSLELSQRDSETRPVETKSLEDREHGADWSDRGRLDSSLIWHDAGDSAGVTAKRGLVTTLTDSPVRSESAVTEPVSIERNIGTRAQAASAGGEEVEVLFLNEEVETCVEENTGKTEIPKISRSGTNGAFVSDCSARERSPTDISGRNKHTIEGRLDDLSEAVSPIPETETAVGADGEVIRRRRFVKQVSFQWEAGKLRQVVGDADKEDAEVESVPVTVETSPPDSPKKGILTRGRFSGKRDHPSLSKQTGKMYRRPKSEIFDNALRKEIPVKASSDVARQRPKSALYLSEADDVPVERGRAMPKHYRPQSDSLMQLDKFDSLQIKPKARRERSPSPGLRGFTSPVTQRKLRDRRRPQQRMLPPPSNTLRMPRQPRPGRMAVIIDALKNGLLDSIRVSNEKLEIMKQHQEETKAGEKSRQGFHYNLDKQLKAAERFIRKLQFHLAKVEELQELYEKELKVREGAMNMVKAYHDTHSPKAKEPVNEAKVGWRDCTQALCHMEAELEANLGAFVLRIEGIAGFARVTRGDVFEITFKYGFQKWKTKCKVEKDLSQTWEGDEIVLYPMVGDFLTIKVTEIRGIARSNVTIGNLEFDTSDFYGAEPQNLTIDVNETGTIKLNIIVTWSPFHVDEEDLKQINKNSYHRRERTFTDSAVSAHKRLSTASTSSSSDTPHSPVRPKPKPLEFPSSPTLTLEEALHNVVRLLEILAGQYNELKPLEQQITHLDSFLRKNLEKKRRESTISLSVKNALDSFNFLNEMDEGLSESLDSGSMEETNRKNVLDSLDVVPKSHSSDRLSDSTCIEDDFPAQLELRGIHRPSPSTTPTSNSTSTMSSPPSSTSSSVKRSSRFLDLSEKRESRMLELNEQRGNRLLDSPGDSSFGSMRRLPGSDREEPLNLTTGSDSIDLTLTHHLMFIEYLLSHLGAFGPLKLKETIALDKLQKQAVIIEQLIVLAVSGVHVASADEVLPELKLNLPLLEFWEQCKEKEALYVNADSFLLQLDVKFGAKLRTNHPEIADDVFQSLCHRIIERPADLLSPKTIITLFQYISFFTQESRRNPEKCINDLTNEFELTASLEPGNPELLRTIKRIPKGFLLPAGNLRAMGLLLLEDSSTVQMGVRLYLESIAREDDLRQRAVTVYQECLEERDLSLRQAGCAALAAMHATEALEQLVYLLRCDIDDVKTTAKESLMAFGDEGRLACEQVSYSPYFAYEQQYTQNGTSLMTTEL